MITPTRVVSSIPPKRLIYGWIILHDFRSIMCRHVIQHPRSGLDKLCRTPPLPISRSSSPIPPHLLPHLPARHTHYSPGGGGRQPRAEAGGGEQEVDPADGDGRRNRGGRARARLLLGFDLLHQPCLCSGGGLERGSWRRPRAWGEVQAQRRLEEVHSPANFVPVAHGASSQRHPLLVGVTAAAFSAWPAPAFYLQPARLFVTSQTQVLPLPF